MSGLREPVPAERVRDALERVLAGDEFRTNPFARWLEDLLRRISDALSGFGGIDAKALFQGLVAIAWVLAIALAVLLLVLLFTRLARAARAAVPGPEGLVARRVAELLERAREAERAGDLLLALRLFFFALVVGLGERGELAYRDAWTNRELLDRGRPSAAVRARLAPIVQDLDRKSFGREPVTRADLDRLRGLAEAWVSPAAASRAREGA